MAGRDQFSFKQLDGSDQLRIGADLVDRQQSAPLVEVAFDFTETTSVQRTPPRFFLRPGGRTSMSVPVGGGA